MMLLTTTQAGQYELQLNPADPDSATLLLRLEAPLAEAAAYFTRQLGETAQPPTLRCANLEVDLEPTNGGWIAPAGCTVITREVAFHRIDGPNVDVSEQANLYYPGRWWLFTEWNDLLRSQAGLSHESAGLSHESAGLSHESAGLSHGSICVTYDDETTCRTVPGLNQPPLFLLVGQPDHVHATDGTTFRFFHGLLPEDFEAGTLISGLERQLAYLTRIAPEQSGDPVIPEAIDVLILGIDESLGMVGGAAGHSAWLTNVAVSADGVDPRELIRLQWITGHELFHLLSIDQAPLWAGESLAHYYGFKSLGENESAATLFDQMLEHGTDMGLLEAHHRVTQQGEGQYYGLFYTSGAAFWRALDGLISEATGGEKDLDVHLSMLRNHEFGPGGELPEAFVEAIAEQVGNKALSRLLAQFL